MAVLSVSEPPSPLIPGLPDDVAELCLLRLPFPHQSSARSVSSSWNRAISDPSFSIAKKTLSLSHPYLFVLAFDPSSPYHHRCLAFNPQSCLWSVLPPIPSSHLSLSPPSSASAAVSAMGALFVFGGLRTDTNTAVPALFRYSAGSNSWSAAAPMPNPRSFFSAASVGSKIVVTGDDNGVDVYDPVNDNWSSAAVGSRLSPYDAAVVGRKMYVTEGWSWPFEFLPRGGVFDSEKGDWEEMKAGMREGWTGMSVVVGDRLLVVSEHSGARVKAYVDETDGWEYVSGGGVPKELKRPFAAAGEAENGVVYVVGSGLSVAVGRLTRSGGGAAGGGGSLRLEWTRVDAPSGLRKLVPTSAHLLYA